MEGFQKSQYDSGQFSAIQEYFQDSKIGNPVT